jgi:ribosome-associated heat shock protein Hsp15
MRVDRWLYFARIFKSRSLAQTAIDEGRVWVEGKTTLKPSDSLKIGDRLVVNVGPAGHRWLTVAAPGTRRGPPAEAATLYQEQKPL